MLQLRFYPVSIIGKLDWPLTAGPFTFDGMAKIKSKTGKFKSWLHAARRLPVLSVSLLQHGTHAATVGAVKTVFVEGPNQLHWKILGDGLVRFFQDSGPVLTKIGQILATRNDFLPDTLCSRLEALYRQQPPMSAAQLKKILKQAYPDGLPFQSFDDRAFGVGSVGQVHRATLPDGAAVIVKLIRPDSARKIERDIAAALALVDGLSWVWGKKRRGTRMMVAKALDDLRLGFLSELDLEAEAAAIESFQKRLRRNPRVYVPRCYREFSSEHVLVIEELKGEPLSSFRKRAEGNPVLARQLADLALKEILTQIFDEGLFHADPHAGNLLVLEDGRLGLIDFGLTGEFTRQNRKHIAKAIRALLARDADTLITSLLGFGTTPPDFDLVAFKKDVVIVVARRKEQVQAQLSGKGEGQLDSFVNELFEVAYRHRIHVPQSTTLLIKTLVTIEGVARSLDPQINLLKAAAPVVAKALTPKWLRFGSLFDR